LFQKFTTCESFEKLQSMIAEIWTREKLAQVVRVLILQPVVAVLKQTLDLLEHQCYNKENTAKQG